LVIPLVRRPTCRPPRAAATMTPPRVRWPFAHDTGAEDDDRPYRCASCATGEARREPRRLCAASRSWRREHSGAADPHALRRGSCPPPACPLRGSRRRWRRRAGRSDNRRLPAAALALPQVAAPLRAPAVSIAPGGARSF
jgi:hypothetical protein